MAQIAMQRCPRSPLDFSFASMRFLTISLFVQKKTYLHNMKLMEQYDTNGMKKKDLQKCIYTSKLSLKSLFIC